MKVAQITKKVPCTYYTVFTFALNQIWISTLRTFEVLLPRQLLKAQQSKLLDSRPDPDLNDTTWPIYRSSRHFNVLELFGHLVVTLDESKMVECR